MTRWADEWKAHDEQEADDVMSGRKEWMALFRHAGRSNPGGAGGGGCLLPLFVTKIILALMARREARNA